MFSTSIALGLLAVVLAWPVPIALSAARWPARAPALALLLWQAIALAGGLSMIGALLTFGLDPFGTRLTTSIGPLFAALGQSEMGQPAGAALAFDPAISLWHLLSLCAAALLGTHLIANLVLTIVSTERRRRRHRELLTLLSTALADQPHTRVINTATLMAYCVPGAPHPVTVVSEGLRELLDEAEFDAVVAHEHAHLSQRHDLLLIAFRAWHISLPWLPTAYRAEREVSLLVEMLADDRARTTVDDQVLAMAISLVSHATGHTVAGHTAAGQTLAGSDASNHVSSTEHVDQRIRRLDQAATSVPLATRMVIVTMAVSVVAVPSFLLLLAP